MARRPSPWLPEASWTRPLRSGGARYLRCQSPTVSAAASTRAFCTWAHVSLVAPIDVVDRSERRSRRRRSPTRGSTITCHAGNQALGSRRRRRRARTPRTHMTGRGCWARAPTERSSNGHSSAVACSGYTRALARTSEIEGWSGRGTLPQSPPASHVAASETLILLSEGRCTPGSSVGNRSGTNRVLQRSYEFTMSTSPGSVGTVSQAAIRSP